MTASSALSKTTKKESPSVASSRPPWAAKAARRSAAWRSRTAVYAALPSDSSSRVEPSMSENRKVSVAA
jgi:hypothetical protein